ncbi:alpha-L-rhamnosidase C-terminal domain-containing protein [Streptomyces sp. NPDC005811]|uniref:alpha-L-rhamnosidase C-terminal domain-containing protein n=1 Tax=Streptomyces sp. NPDC005811 TaxID=3154565 RepID=UPI0033E7622A
MHRVVAGLPPGAPGYRTLRVEPRPGGGLTWVRTAHRTPYGLAEVAWERVAGELRVEIAVPTGSTAVVVLPEAEQQEVGPGSHRFAVPYRDPADAPSGILRRRSLSAGTVATVREAHVRRPRSWASTGRAACRDGGAEVRFRDHLFRIRTPSTATDPGSRQERITPGHVPTVEALGE